MVLRRREVDGSDEAGFSGIEAGPSGSEPVVPRRFPLAAQPEIMRAAEKDDQYASFVYDACRDAFRHLFGLLLFLSLFSFWLLYLVGFRKLGIANLSGQCSAVQASSISSYLPTFLRRKILTNFLIQKFRTMYY